MNPYGVEIQVCALGGLVDDKIHNEYMAILKRNGRKLKEDLTAYELDTIKNHTTGNDQFKIDQWVDNYDMKAVPAFNSMKKTWQNYAKNTNYTNFKELEKQTEVIIDVLKKENKKPPKFSYSYSELFDGSYDSLVNYFIPRKALEKSKKAIEKKTHAKHTKH